MYFGGKITFGNLYDVKLKIVTQGGIVWRIVCTPNYT